MTPDVATALRRLLVSASAGEDTSAIAAGAGSAFDLLTRHVARLIGELGVRTLFARSLSLAGAAYPCLRTSPSPTESPEELLRRCLEHESPDAALEPAVHVFLTFIQLLERFIGAGLVASLLHEVWPTSFPADVPKEST